MNKQLDLTHLFPFAVQHEALNDYGHTMVLLTQFDANGHFIRDITIKYFYNPLHNEAILYKYLVI